MLRSLLAELLGPVPAENGAAALFEHLTTPFALLVSEGETGMDYAIQEEALAANKDALRSLGIDIILFPARQGAILIDGRSSGLPSDEACLDTQNGSSGDFAVLLIERRGQVLLRSNIPVGFEQIQEAVQLAPGTSEL
jgi:hypothetical protein